MEELEERSRVGGEVVYLGHQVLAEASRKRFYGKGTLKRVCEENEIAYSRGKTIVSGYKGLLKLEIAHRRAIVDAIREGELHWSKVEVMAPVKDEEAYVDLAEEAISGDLSKSDLQQEVKEIKGPPASPPRSVTTIRPRCGRS